MKSVSYLYIDAGINIVVYASAMLCVGMYVYV